MVLMIPSGGGDPFGYWDDVENVWWTSNHSSWTHGLLDDTVQYWAYLKYPTKFRWFSKWSWIYRYRWLREYILSWFNLADSWPMNYIPNAKPRIKKRKWKYPLW